MPSLDAFLELVGRLAPEHIYRTVYDPDLQVIVPGKEQIDATMLDAFSRIDFRGKTVVDLGCNFGFFTFLARRLGAASVVGVDCEPGVLDGCRMLERHFGADRVAFERHDILAPECALSGRTFDIAMLVEFIGKGFILDGLVAPALSLLERLSERELVLSIQKIYWIRKELRSTPDRLAALYGPAYVSGGDFLLFDYVRDFFCPRWRLEPLSDLGDGYDKPRKFLRFVR